MSRSKWHILRLGLAAPVMLAVLTGAQCPKASTTAPIQPPAIVKTEPTEKMVYDIQTNVQNLGSLRCTARVVVTDMKQLVPTNMTEAELAAQGETYSQKYNRRELNGYFLLDRTDRERGPKVKFWAEITAVGRVLDFVAVGDNFWVKMLKPDRKLNDFRDNLYFGKLDPEAPRPAGAFSMRPQDFFNLFVCQELLVTAPFRTATMRETWPDYYILQVLRSPNEWAEAIYSKIWVERHNLTVAIHQLYDPNGELLAEGRFSNYIQAGESDRPLWVPLQCRFIWPRDKVTIDLYMNREDLKVNYKVDEKVWARPKENTADLFEITQGARGMEFSPISHDNYPPSEEKPPETPKP